MTHPVKIACYSASVCLFYGIVAIAAPVFAEVLIAPFVLALVAPACWHRLTQQPRHPRRP